MDYAFDGDSGFYHIALELFSDAGLTDVSDPLYFNHSPDQLIYFDCLNPVNYSIYQRCVLKKLIHNISFLFEFDDDTFERRSGKTIRFFCAELFCETAERSQIACYVHSQMCPVLDCDASVFLFEHNGFFMISIIGFNNKCILSDWYYIDDYGSFIDKLNIANTRLDTAAHYLSDLIYSIARPYYTHPISIESAMYLTLPDNYYTVNKGIKLSREELKEMIQDALRFYEYKYGDDYVNNEQCDIITSETNEIRMDVDIDMMLLSLQDDENDDVESLDETFDDDSYSSAENDEPNTEAVDPQIFRDPVLMVKWIETHSGNN